MSRGLECWEIKKVEIDMCPGDMGRGLKQLYPFDELASMTNVENLRKTRSRDDFYAGLYYSV